jgi:transmembrane sensor
MDIKDEHEYSRIVDLITKQIDNALSVEEQAELDCWLVDGPGRHAVYERLTDEVQRHEALRRMGRFDEEAAWARFAEMTGAAARIITIKRPRKLLRYTAAAAIAAGMAFGGYLIIRPKTPNQQITQIQQHDIPPGHNQATLKLPNGRQIILTAALNGQVAQLGSTRVTANGSNGISYAKGLTAAYAAAETVGDNILSTARGEQSPYPLILADGTKVWLNAESSIKFPTRFTGSNRMVTITGEAYIEVVHNPAKPFKVLVKDQTIEDIGTTFDINAYDDEPATRTTLISGSIRIAKDGQKAVLKPGQQADIQTGTNVIIIKNADTEETTAWIHGQFRFNDEKLGSIMRQVSRWYNVDVTYQDEALKEKPFAGVTTRFGNVSELLHMLEMTGEVKFKIEGKKIVVLDK